MTEFYIFRHGDTIESSKLSIRFLGHKGSSFDLPILPKGIPALKRIGEYLKKVSTDINFCSPYIRCVNSAKIAGEAAGKKFQVDERIRELEKNGESFNSFRKRVADFLNEINEHGYTAISICTHGAVISALKHLTRGDKFRFFQVMEYPAPGNLVIIKNGKVETKNFNRS